jgi:hypothetical protein
MEQDVMAISWWKNDTNKKTNQGLFHVDYVALNPSLLIQCWLDGGRILMRVTCLGRDPPNFRVRAHAAAWVQ